MTVVEGRLPPVHRRSIEVETFEEGENTLIVEGRLRDNRFSATHSFGGTVFPPGIVHDMIIRLALRRSDLTIEALEVRMPAAPRAECREMKESLERFRGTAIGPGFTAKVRAEVGGTGGCAHLTALFMAMAPAVVQGAWSAKAQQPLNLKRLGKESLALLENSCHVWRSGGPAMEELHERIRRYAPSKDRRLVTDQ